jgi:hypothetical protein
MTGWIFRLAVAVGAAMGLLEVFAVVAMRWMPDQHCEPLQGG